MQSGKFSAVGTPEMRKSGPYILGPVPTQNLGTPQENLGPDQENLGPDHTNQWSQDHTNQWS